MRGLDAREPSGTTLSLSRSFMALCRRVLDRIGHREEGGEAASQQFSGDADTMQANGGPSRLSFKF